MAEPTTNYCPTTASFKMIQESANDNTIASAVQKTVPTPTLYDDFDSLRSFCITSLIDTVNGGTQGVTPTSSSDFRGYPLPTIDMDYSVVVTGEDPDEIIETFTCLPTMNNKVGFEVKFRVDVWEWRGSPPSPDYLEWIFTFNSGSVTPDLVTRDAVTQSLTNGRYQLNVDYEASSGNPENITVITDYIYQSAYAPIIMDSADQNQTLYYTPEVIVYLLTDFWKYTVGNCGQSPSIVLDYYSRDGPTTEVGDTIYSNAAATTKITDSYGATNRVPTTGFPIVAFDWFTVSTGVVGSFNACNP